MSDDPKHVTDVNGVLYRLDRRLGQGGQGDVYEVAGGRHAVKLLRAHSRERAERLRNQVAFVRRLPLEGMPIARPLSTLREPYLGYVMDLVTGMRPLSDLVAPPREVTSVTGWYIETGGLRRRLRVAARTADALHALHSEGLAYGDPSPTNVLVSASTSADEVFLIDADNIMYESRAGSSFLHTLGYAAPEIVTSKSGVSSLTDAHAFAVIAFRLIALTHPLIGDAIDHGEPTLEEAAYKGLLPWIEHPVTATNRATSGIARELVLSKGLRAQFERAFGPGLATPTLRPGVGEWAQRLHAAADATVRCRQCTGTYYATGVLLECPWCGAQRPPIALVTVVIWDPQVGPGGGLVRSPKGLTSVGTIIVTDGEERSIPRRIVADVISADGELPALIARREGARLLVRSADDRTYEVRYAHGDRVQTVGARPVPFDLAGDRARLHLGPLDKLHRVLLFHEAGGRSA